MVRSGSISIASLNRACRDHRLAGSATLTTMTFDHSSLRWLGISDLIAESEGPSFIAYSCGLPFGPVMLVTQDPERTWVAIGRIRPCQMRAIRPFSA